MKILHFALCCESIFDMIINATLMALSVFYYVKLQLLWSWSVF